MKADHAAQLRLLDLQAADTALAQLRHRRSSLPELATLTERSARAAELATQIVELETALADVAGEQRRLENEVDAVRSRATRDEQRLQSGGVPSKELEGLQHEITSLARRQSTLEDELLEVMERREESDARLISLDHAAQCPRRRDRRSGGRARPRVRRDRRVDRGAYGRAVGDRRASCPPTCSRCTSARASTAAASARRCCGSGGARAAGSSCPAARCPRCALPTRTRSSGATTVAASSSAPSESGL